ncbi:MAG: lipopolysaccharide core heptose(I) kinase RfaP [Desulfobacterales bacterium]|nr:lipopolysaccharide core heptose(I) kinase RfaP [Desulfobacterales bacterium]
MIVLSKFFQDHFKGLDIFETLFSLDGKVYREKDGRKTFRTAIGGKNYFIKIYRGIGWKALLKSLLRFRMPILSAQKEWGAIKQLESLSIETMRLAGYGKRGRSPANRQSFVITDELASTLSLENLCRDWPSSPPTSTLKRALITRVAHVARILHENKIVHRDFYICHFLFDTSFKREIIHHSNLHLYLIDLHRTRKQFCFQKRGKMKDLAALYFSSMDIGLNSRDIFRFMRIYQNKPLKSALYNKLFWYKVNRRAISLYRKAHGCKPSSII